MDFEEGNGHEGGHNAENSDDDIAWTATSGGPTPRGPSNENESATKPQPAVKGSSPNDVDLCILCDVTSSMDEWIGEIKEEISNFVKALRATSDLGTLRLAFIGYRDWDGDDQNNDGHQRLELCPLSAAICEFEALVDAVEAVGGGDAAEDVLGGIAATLVLDWRAPIRVVYHMFCHFDF